MNPANWNVPKTKYLINRDKIMVEIKVPSPGESITQVQVARWLAADGEAVEKDQEIVEIDSDKATFPLASPVDGMLIIAVPEGEIIAVGTVIARVEESSSQLAVNHLQQIVDKVPAEASSRVSYPASHIPPASPLARNIISVKRIDPEELAAAFPGKKITRKDIDTFLSQPKVVSPEDNVPGNRAVERKKLSVLRLKLAERLVAVKNETAMLTTFNEINMRKMLGAKEQYSIKFQEKYGVGVGLISFFAKACSIALLEFPQVNSMIDGEELILYRYVDLGIAVSAPKGLVVPVIRNTESMSLTEIELRVKEMALKARENRITLDDMRGGTFTISNGGIFGSLLSTPILNPPQSAILGLHRIMDRPIAVGGKVEIHPMMYVALSYDHRVIDGKESVGFLVRIKELMEDPATILPELKDLIL